MIGEPVDLPIKIAIDLPKSTGRGSSIQVIKFQPDIFQPTKCRYALNACKINSCTLEMYCTKHIQACSTVHTHTQTWLVGQVMYDSNSGNRMQYCKYQYDVFCGILYPLSYTEKTKTIKHLHPHSHPQLRVSVCKYAYIYIYYTLLHIL